MIVGVEAGAGRAEKGAGVGAPHVGEDAALAPPG